MNKPKIAVCLYGFLRDFNEHCLSLRENILEPYDTDLYGYFPYEVDEDDHRKVPNESLREVYEEENKAT